MKETVSTLSNILQQGSGNNEAFQETLTSTYSEIAKSLLKGDSDSVEIYQPNIVAIFRKTNL